MLKSKTRDEIRIFHGLPPHPDPIHGGQPPEIGEDPLINSIPDHVARSMFPRAEFDPLGDGISRVKVIKVVGSDKDVVDAARVSFDGDDLDAPFNWKKDVRLIKYLIEHNHGSPLEHNLLKFYITAPNFIIKQMLR